MGLALPVEFCAPAQMRCQRQDCLDLAAIEVPLDDREPPRWVCLSGHSGLVLRQPPPTLSGAGPRDRGIRSERRALGLCLNCGAAARPRVYCPRCRQADRGRRR